MFHLKELTHNLPTFQMIHTAFATLHKIIRERERRNFIKHLHVNPEKEYVEEGRKIRLYLKFTFSEKVE